MVLRTISNGCNDSILSVALPVYVADTTSAIVGLGAWVLWGLPSALRRCWMISQSIGALAPYMSFKFHTWAISNCSICNEFAFIRRLASFFSRSHISASYIFLEFFSIHSLIMLPSLDGEVDPDTVISRVHISSPKKTDEMDNAKNEERVRSCSFKQSKTAWTLQIALFM